MWNYIIYKSEEEILQAIDQIYEISKTPIKNDYISKLEDHLSIVRMMQKIKDKGKQAKESIKRWGRCLFGK